MKIDYLLQDVYKQLRSYQREGCDIMFGRQYNLNYDDMGLGKTICTLWTAISKSTDIFTDENIERTDYPEHILIVCPKKALYVWQDEIQKWFGLDSLIYAGTKKQREKMRTPDECSGYSEIEFFPFIITTYGMLEEL